MNLSLRRILSLALFVLAAFLALGTSSGTPPHPVGTGGHIITRPLYLAKTQADARRFFTAFHVEKDNSALRRMEGRKQVVKAEPGLARVLERGARADDRLIRVRIMSGKSKGQEGWIPNGYLSAR
ncbi:hypothetical protein EON81_13985 [bacterium]|nr:MAG: hypothetical protein EON81_13985 [bacterium]